MIKIQQNKTSQKTTTENRALSNGSRNTCVVTIRLRVQHIHQHSDENISLSVTGGCYIRWTWTQTTGNSNIDNNKNPRSLGIHAVIIPTVVFSMIWKENTGINHFFERVKKSLTKATLGVTVRATVDWSGLKKKKEEVELVCACWSPLKGEERKKSAVGEWIVKTKKQQKKPSKSSQGRKKPPAATTVIQLRIADLSFGVASTLQVL